MNEFDPSTTPPERITERQLAFAMCLGIPLTPEITLSQLSKEIDNRLHETTLGPPNSIQRGVAKYCGERITWNTTSKTLSKRLWEVYVDVGTEFVSDKNQRIAFGSVIESFIDGNSSGKPLSPERVSEGIIGCLFLTLIFGLLVFAIVIILIVF